MFRFWKNFKERLEFNSRDNIRNRTRVAQRTVNGHKEYHAAICYLNRKMEIEHEHLEIHVANNIKDSSVCLGGLTTWTHDKDAVKYALDNFIKLNEGNVEEEPIVFYERYP